MFLFQHVHFIQNKNLLQHALDPHTKRASLQSANIIYSHP